MEEVPGMSENARSGVSASTGRTPSLIDFILALAFAALALGYGYQQRLKVRHLAAQGLVAKATINDLERQLDDMSDKLNNVASAQQGATDSSGQTQGKK